MNEEMTRGYMKSFFSYVNSAILLLAGLSLIMPVVYSYIAHAGNAGLVYFLFGLGFICVGVAVIKMFILLNKSKERI